MWKHSIMEKKRGLQVCASWRLLAPESWKARGGLTRSGTSYVVGCVFSHSVTSSSLQPQGYLPDSSVHGIPQASILEWVAIPFSRGSSRPEIELRFSALQPDSSPYEPPGKPTWLVRDIYLRFSSRS